MTEFICGLIGLMLGAGLLALGALAGRGRDRAASRPEAPDEEARERLRQIEADRRAFRALMGYNADVAYGTERLEREDGA